MPKIPRRVRTELIQGDCLDVMKGIPAGSVDLVLVDPPYGTTQCKWDSVIPLEHMWKELKRVTYPNSAIVLTAAQPFTSALVMSNPSMYKYVWVWDKVNRPTGHLNSKKQPLRQVEDVLVFYSKQCTYNPQMVQGLPYRANGSRPTENYGSQKYTTTICDDGLRYPRNLISIPADERGTVGRMHSTQKPIALMEYFIKTYTRAGDVVLDFAMGSGTTGVAAKNLNRSFIGIELDPDIFTIAKTRIENA